MVDFAKFKLKKLTKEEALQSRKDKYYKLLTENNIIANDRINAAIDTLAEEFHGVLEFGFGQYKGESELVIAIRDKSYYIWYLGNIKYPRNICYDISEKLYYILYGE